MKSLPPGQKEIKEFPRFGLPKFTNRFPSVTQSLKLSIGGDLEDFVLSDPLSGMSTVQQTSDFHCVTTWSKLDLQWSGVRFSDFYKAYISPKAQDMNLSFVVFKSQDGYKTSLPLKDLLRDDVLLADGLGNKPLCIAHGAPLRLVAPDHYGYKNPKHLHRIEFYKEAQKLKSGLARIIDHPRGRVAHEERANFAAGWMLRIPYKAGINKTIKDYQEALDKHLEKLAQ